MASRPPTRLNSSTSHPRRNLFASTSLRRPTSSSTASVGTGLLDSADKSDGDIVVRKPDGNLTAITPVVSNTDGDMVIEEEQEDDEGRLKDLLRNRRQSNETELLELLTVSLRRKAAELESDKWIHEQEDSKS